MKILKEEVLAIHFFVNMSSVGTLGNSLLMLVTPFNKMNEFIELIEDEMYLSITGTSDCKDFNILMGKAEGKSLSYDMSDFLNKKIFLASTPIPDGLWEKSREDQKNIIENIKFREAAKVLDCSISELYSDLDRLDIILEKYTTEEKNLNSHIFVQISDIYHVSVKTYS